MEVTAQDGQCVPLGSSAPAMFRMATKDQDASPVKSVKKSVEVFFSQLFRPKVFDMDFPKSFYGVFELPLLRNAQKRHKNLKNLKNLKKGGTYLPDLSSARYTSLSFFFSSAPLERSRRRAVRRR
jgi:hypothetical protein